MPKKMKKILITLLLVILVTSAMLNVFADPLSNQTKIISYSTSPKNIHFYHKTPKGEYFTNFKSLKNYLSSQDKRLTFAMNGGMYLRDLSPQGLYIENGNILKNIDTTQEAYGNFYMQPNGIFYITKNKKAHVVATKDFHLEKNINFATQSGPMLLINGKIHHKFMPHSKNVHIRNGVGILPNGNLLFAISKQKINFYNFANFFKHHGCKNALYLDGFVSRMYLPSKHIIQRQGLFGVIIAETVDK